MGLQISLESFGCLQLEEAVSILSVIINIKFFSQRRGPTPQEQIKIPITHPKGETEHMTPITRIWTP